MNNLNLNALKFLICDDNEMMKEILKTFLKSFGVSKIITTKAGDCFDTFNDEKPDIVLLDWFMPQITGVEITKLIRNSKNSHNVYVPIILITAETDADQIKIAKNSGINDILCKPVAKTVLYKKICNVIENPRNFIKAKDYFGPDRRRFVTPNWTKIEKRDTILSDSYSGNIESKSVL